MNSQRNAAMLFISMKELRTGFKTAKKIINFFGLFALPFSVNINVCSVHFQMKQIKLQSDAQLETDRVSLLDFCTHSLTREKYL